MDNKRMCLEAIHYLLTKIGETDKIKIVKLMYFADKMHLMLFGRTITDDKFIAMNHGPVGSNVLDILNINFDLLEHVGKYGIKAKSILVEYDYLSKSDMIVIDKIAQKFKDVDQWEIVELTHKYPEWAKYEKKFLNKSSNREDINTLDLFSTIDNDPLNVPDSIIRESRDIYLGIC